MKMQKFIFGLLGAVASFFGAAATAASLPTGYQELEWIESTGAQSVDLGFVIDAKTSRVEMKFNSGAYKNASVYFGTAYNFNCFLFLQQNNLYRFYGSGGHLDIGTATDGNANLDMTLTVAPKGDETGDVTLDCPTGKAWTTATLKGTSTKTSAANLRVFSDSNGGNMSAFRLYRFTVTDTGTGTVVHDFVPTVRVSDSVAGLYDVCVANASSAFRTDAKGKEGFLTGAVITYGDKLTVSGVPLELGAVEPAYGKHGDYAAGTDYTLTASAAWQSEDGRVRAVCAGCTVTEIGGTLIASATYSADDPGDTRSLTYAHPDCANGVEAVWSWDVLNKVTVAVAGNGTVSIADDWIPSGGKFEVTATPTEGSNFLQWGDRETGEVLGTDPTLRLDVNGPRQISAVFVSSTIPYDPSIADYTAIIKSVIEAAKDGDEITFEDGAYTFKERLLIDKGITLTGSHREACTLKGDAGTTFANAIVLNHKAACIKNVTIADVVIKASFVATDAAVYIKAGTLADARVTGCTVSGVNGNNMVGVVLDSNPAKEIEAFLTNTIIDHNDATGGKVGGVSFAQGGLMLNCLVWANVGKETGGVRVAPGGYKFAKVVNCTIVGNAGGTHGGGLEVAPQAFGILYDCGPWIVNTIIADNTSTTEGKEDLCFGSDRAKTDTCFSCLCPTVADFGKNSVKGDPLFVNPAKGDFRLQDQTSAAYNAGDLEKATSVLEYEAGRTVDLATTFDLEGNPRVKYRRLDLGCHELVKKGGLMIIVR